MSILIYAESTEGKLKKVAYELASYAKKIADTIGSSVTAVTINSENVSDLSKYGVSKVLKIRTDKLNDFNAKAYADCIKQVALHENSTLIVLSSSTDSIYMAPFIAIGLNAGFVSNVVELPIGYTPFQVKRTAFSNKAFNLTEVNTEIKIVSLSKNSYGLHENDTAISEEEFIPVLNDSDFNVKVASVEKSTGKVTIADAEVVVSGGRGLKGPENWSVLEDLASALGAATACSKPVSDLGWRPHSEHVGQTGKPVAANLYVAVGISGAIQHIAGINSSKVKVVINTDADAPFFKVADYGIVGDALEILPRLTQKIIEFKANNA